MSELTPEMREKVLACKTPEEFLALAKEAGRELTDEELEAVAGGEVGWNKMQCPRCYSHNTEQKTSLYTLVIRRGPSCGLSIAIGHVAWAVPPPKQHGRASKKDAMISVAPMP